jgi:NTP pyrophosphatase (non-canonical NTP hydrolase)
MLLDDYQIAAFNFARYPEKFAITYPVCLLCEEAGEVMGKLSKALRKGGFIDAETRGAMIKELGDVLWALSAAALDLHAPLSLVATLNLEKLEKRRQTNTLVGEGDNREEADPESSEPRDDTV